MRRLFPEAIKSDGVSVIVDRHALSAISASLIRAIGLRAKSAWRDDALNYLSMTVTTPSKSQK